MPVTYYPWYGTWLGFMAVALAIAVPVYLLVRIPILVSMVAGLLLGFGIQALANRRMRFQCPSCLLELHPVS